MQPITDFDFIALNFDEDGTLINPQQLETLKDHARQATDAIFLAHGFRNDEDDAGQLYANLLHTLKQNMARSEFHDALGARRFVVAGVFWPSKAFLESFPDDSIYAELEALKSEVEGAAQAKVEEAKAVLPRLMNDPDAQDAFVASVLSAVPDTQSDPMDGLERIRSQNGSDVLQKLRLPLLPVVLSGPDDADDGGGVAAVAVAAGAFQEQGAAQSFGSVLGTILGAAGKLLNFATWYIMKNRSGVVGSTGVAQAVRDLKAACPEIRVHLVGHSLGGRLMAACTNALAQDPQLRPDSVSLLEAAFSHYGFSSNNGDGQRGFFRDVIDRHAVRGPFISTYSFQDDVVGLDYSVASRLADDNVKAIGDANDPFGGIGRNGCQKTDESCVIKLKIASNPDGPYSFQIGKVNCLDGSGGLIQNHGDVANENVTYAVASAIAGT